jgi:hypothetical protein
VKIEGASKYQVYLTYISRTGSFYTMRQFGDAAMRSSFEFHQIASSKEPVGRISEQDIL